MDYKFFSKPGNLHSITTEWPEISDDRLILIDHTCEIAGGIQVIAHISQMQFYTSHCTGDHVFEVMQTIMPTQLHPFTCGTTKE